MKHSPRFQNLQIGHYMINCKPGVMKGQWNIIKLRKKRRNQHVWGGLRTLSRAARCGGLQGQDTRNWAGCWR